MAAEVIFMVRSERKQYGHDADDFGTDLCLWPRDDAAFQQDMSTPFSILIEFEAIKYSMCIRNFEDMKWNSSHP